MTRWGQRPGRGGIRPLLAIAALGTVGFLLVRSARAVLWMPLTGSGTGVGLGAGESRDSYTVVARGELPTTGTVVAFYLERPSVATLKAVVDVGSVYPTWGNEAMRIPKQYRHD